MPKAQRTFTKEFKLEAVHLAQTSGKSPSQVARDLGIAESTLSRFMSGERGLTMKCLDRLAALLDLHIAAGKRPKKKG